MRVPPVGVEPRIQGNHQQYMHYHPSNTCIFYHLWHIYYCHLQCRLFPQFSEVSASCTVKCKRVISSCTQLQVLGRGPGGAAHPETLHYLSQKSKVCTSGLPLDQDLDLDPMVPKSHKYMNVTLQIGLN